MGAKQSDTDLTTRIFPIVMAVVAVVVAALVAAMPQASLDLLMWRLWLPHIVAAATPPIGVTGRTILALLALLPFAAIAGAAWVLRGRLPTMAVRRRAAAPVVEKAPAVRRADSHPDAPPRRPIRASEDLGPPLPIVTVSVTRGVPEPEQPLPADLDQPLAAFDPIAVPDVPREPVRAVAPLVPTPPMRPLSEVDYAWASEPDAADPEAEAMVLPFLAIAPDPEPEPEPDAVEPVMPEPVAVAMPEPEPESAPEPELFVEAPASPIVERPQPGPGLRRGAVEETAATEPLPTPAAGDVSISSLLDRLERGARKKAVPAPEPEAAPAPVPVASLDDTLVMLRRLASG